MYRTRNEGDNKNSSLNSRTFNTTTKNSDKKNIHRNKNRRVYYGVHKKKLQVTKDHVRKDFVISIQVPGGT